MTPDFIGSERVTHPIFCRLEKPMKSKTPPWKKPAPAKSKHTALNPAKKSAAKARATKAGRPYPNMVDNMWASRKK